MTDPDPSVLRVYGRRNSVNVQKVLWCCGELGLDIRNVDLGGRFGGTREPGYLALNPNGLVPTVEEPDGFALWESNAIVRYLAEQYGTAPFFPSETRRRALAGQWMDWASTLVMSRPNMPTVYTAMVRTAPEARDTEALQRGLEALSAAWGVLDAHLAGSAHVAGDGFSMGDIPLGALAYRWYGMDIERPETPHLRRWLDGIEARPAFQAHIAGPLT